MNRLTRRNGAGSAIPNNGFGGLTNSAGQQIINALAAYEDTGLTPEQITEMQRQISDGTLVRVNERVIRDEYCQFNSNGTCSASACFAASVKCGAKDENGHPRYNWT